MLQKLALALFLLVSWGATQEAQGAWVITHDRGGRIGTYVDKYRDLSNTGQTVVIDGICASACTIVLAAVPNERICTTPRARLGFHQAWDVGLAQGGALVQVASREASQMLFALYPAPVRRWIRGKGGLPAPNKMLWLQGKQLRAMYKPCPQGAGEQF